MKKSAERIVGPCVLCGRYFYFEVKTRPPKYCWECAREAARMSNRDRQRAYRQRQREAKTGSNKQSDDTSPRLVADGSRDAFPALPAAPSKRGMFSDLPEPIRTTRRQEVGLR